MARVRWAAIVLTVALCASLTTIAQAKDQNRQLKDLLQAEVNEVALLNAQQTFLLQQNDQLGAALVASYIPDHQMQANTLASLIQARCGCPNVQACVTPPCLNCRNAIIAYDMDQHCRLIRAYQRLARDTCDQVIRQVALAGLNGAYRHYNSLVVARVSNPNTTLAAISNPAVANVNVNLASVASTSDVMPMGMTMPMGTSPVASNAGVTMLGTPSPVVAGSTETLVTGTPAPAVVGATTTVTPVVGAPAPIAAGTTVIPVVPVPVAPNVVGTPACGCSVCPSPCPCPSPCQCERRSVARSAETLLRGSCGRHATNTCSCSRCRVARSSCNTCGVAAVRTSCNTCPAPVAVVPSCGTCEVPRTACCPNNDRKGYNAACCATTLTCADIRAGLQAALTLEYMAVADIQTQACQLQRLGDADSANALLSTLPQHQQQIALLSNSLLANGGNPNIAVPPVVAFSTRDQILQHTRFASTQMVNTYALPVAGLPVDNPIRLAALPGQQIYVTTLAQLPSITPAA